MKGAKGFERELNRVLTCELAPRAQHVCGHECLHAQAASRVVEGGGRLGCGVQQRRWREAECRHPSRQREDRLTHPADTSRSNLAAALALLSRWRLPKPDLNTKRCPQASGRNTPSHEDALCSMVFYCNGITGLKASGGHSLAARAHQVRSLSCELRERGRANLCNGKSTQRSTLLELCLVDECSKRLM